MSEKSLAIIDDDQQLGEMLIEMGTHAGFACKHFSNANDFLSDDQFDSKLLIVDMFLPGVDGIEFLRKISSRQNRYSIILISGGDLSILHAANELAKQFDFNVLGLLKKPFSMTDFHSLLSQHVAFNQTNLSVPTPLITEEEVRHCLKHNLLELHYQPQIDMQSGQIVGLEALARLRHRQRGLVYPDRFLHFVENLGLMPQLTNQVFEQACRALASIQQYIPNIVMGLNVSPRNLNDLAFPDQIDQLRAELNIDARQINLEITETAVCEDLRSFIDVLTRLRMKGFNLSVDDFGTGYFSLVNLVSAPFNEIKIDRFFVSRIFEDQVCRSILEATIALGKQLGYRVVAEGIEDIEIYKAIK